MSDAASESGTATGLGERLRVVRIAAGEAYFGEVPDIYRPTALRVMAEWTESDPVWDSDIDHLGPVALADLRVSDALIERLRAWNQRFNDLHRSDYRWPSVELEKAWRADGLNLAYQLQNELPDIEIGFAHDDDSRPLRRRRGH